MHGLVSARISRTCLANGLCAHTPISGHSYRKFLHTSGPLHNVKGPSEIPMPIGRRPKPDPNKRPTLLLPPAVKYVEQTTPRMRQDDAEEWLYPLYVRGWYVELLRTKDKNRRIRTPFLTTKFLLKDGASARKAVRLVHQLEEKEKHDISYEIFIRKDKPELCLRLQTHSARKYSLGKKALTSSHVTLRDVRFGVLFQEMLEKNDWLDNPELIKTLPPLLLNWDTVLSWFPYSDTDPANPKCDK